MPYTDLARKRGIVKETIQRNPQATYLDIKRATKIKIERVYIGGMGEAFQDADIQPPRTFRRKTIEEKKQSLKLKTIDHMRFVNQKSDSYINICKPVIID